jgi:hypothetical protein
MTTIELIPTLQHCIETTAKMEFNRLTGLYLDLGKEDADIEARLELLRDFLETADFRSLRQESNFYLIVGETVKFIISDKDDALTFRMEVIPAV